MQSVFESGLQLPKKVCVVAPGPAGKPFYKYIPSDYFVIVVSKAVLIRGLKAQLWMMNHAAQPWFERASNSFQGLRVFSYSAYKESEKSHAGHCLYTYEPKEPSLDSSQILPLTRCIRYGATVSACAIQLAYHCGAKEILLCGVDLTGAEYFDGDVNPHPDHQDTWPAVEHLNPLLQKMIKEANICIESLSPTRLNVPVVNVVQLTI